MNSGALRHLVTLDVPNGSAGYLPLDPPTWYCAIRTEGADLATLAGRYHPGITTATRVHVKGRTFHVDEIINREERDVELLLLCREVFE
jgi:hypothetical protein